MKFWQAGAICGLAVAYLATALVPCAPATPLRFSVATPGPASAPVQPPAIVTASMDDCHEEEAPSLGMHYSDGNDHGEGHPPTAPEVASEPVSDAAPVGVRARCPCGCDQPSGPTATSLAWHAPSLPQASSAPMRSVPVTAARISFTSHALETPSPVPLQG